MKNNIKWIMFDWGNVLVKYKPIGVELIAKKLNVPKEKVEKLLINEELFNLFGKGLEKDEKYVELINCEFNGSLNIEQVIEIFSKEINTYIDGIEELIIKVKEKYKLAILSNTFFAHWVTFEKSDFIKYFELPMASHLLGALKPDEEIYKIALEKMKAKPDEVIFIDDLEENVIGAREIGINAFQSTSLKDTIEGLQKYGIL